MIWILSFCDVRRGTRARTKDDTGFNPNVDADKDIISLFAGVCSDKVEMDASPTRQIAPSNTIAIQHFDITDELGDSAASMHFILSSVARGSAHAHSCADKNGLGAVAVILHQRHR